MTLNDFQNSYFQLENDLRELLRPVTPRQEFVGKLERKLFKIPNWKLLLPSLIQEISLVLAAAAGIFFIISTGFRMVMIVLGTATIFRRLRIEASKKRENIKNLLT